MSSERRYRLKDPKLEEVLRLLNDCDNDACVSFDDALKNVCDKLPYPFATNQLIEVEFGPINCYDVQSKKYMYVIRLEPNMIEVSSPFVYGHWNNLRYINIDTVPENIDLLVHCQRPVNSNVRSPMWIFGARFNKATHELIIYNSHYQTNQSVQGLLEHFEDVCVSIYKDPPPEKNNVFTSMLVDNKDNLKYSNNTKTTEEIN